MDTRVRRGLGWALGGALIYGFVALLSLLGVLDDSRVLELLLGWVAVLGVAVTFGALGFVAWRLIRS